MEWYQIGAIIQFWVIILLISYGELNDLNTSILILININNSHWAIGYFNPDNGARINEFIIPTSPIYNNKSELDNNIKSYLVK